MPLPQREFHILLVEDSRADVKIIERALREGNLEHRLTVIPDGRLALDYLMSLVDGETAGKYEPDLILLDLNLPGLDGCQVLQRIKAAPDLRAIPVVVLTTSHREEDIVRTLQAGANTYIPKPEDYPSYRRLVETISHYWVETASRLPHPFQRRAEIMPERPSSAD
jgi:chemotaxis family two-component system response regulator Rcp1